MFKLEINTDNAAFEDPSEVPKILRKIAEKIEAGRMGGFVTDGNGNTCGKWDLE